MLQVIREHSGWLVALARLPRRGIYALRYSYGYSPEYAEFEQDQELSYAPQDYKHTSFTFAVISLSAQVARADGAVSKAEYLAFRDSFPLSGGICGKIRELFMLGCQSKTPFSQHVLQIKQLFPQQKDLYISLIERLFRIATADGNLAKEQEYLLAKIAHLLGLSPIEYSAVHDKYSRPLPAHEVLGVKRRSPREAIKQSYRALMRRYHPDRFAGEQTSTEVKMILTLKSAEISEAYRTITRKVA